MRLDHGEARWVGRGRGTESQALVAGLSGLSDDRLLAGLMDAVRRSQESTASVLAYLAEVERRDLHLKLGYGSLFQYCTEHLGFSEAAAGRRITVARLARRFSGVWELVSLGRIHLSALLVIGPHLDADSCDALLAECCGKTRREVEAVVARIAPKPDAPDSLRRLPRRREARKRVKVVAGGETSGTLNDAVGQRLHSAGAGALVVAGGVGGVDAVGAAGMDEGVGPLFAKASGSGKAGMAPARSALTQTSEERYSLRVAISKDVRDKLLRARELLRHAEPAGRDEVVLDRALDLLLEELERRKYGTRKKQPKSKQKQKEEKRSKPQRKQEKPNQGQQAKPKQGQQEEPTQENKLAQREEGAGPASSAAAQQPANIAGPPPSASSPSSSTTAFTAIEAHPLSSSAGSLRPGWRLLFVHQRLGASLRQHFFC